MRSELWPWRENGVCGDERRDIQPHMDPVLNIRESEDSDLADLERLYPVAFPDEDLVPLLRQLLAGRSDVTSLVAEGAAGLLGHVAFSECRVEEDSQKVSLLGPLAVDPDAQRQGVGTALVQEGIRRLRSLGFAKHFVLGDPGYYSRLGFTAETAVFPPYKLPDEWAGAWQSKLLQEDAAGLEGTLTVPQPWQDKALWLP